MDFLAVLFHDDIAAENVLREHSPVTTASLISGLCASMFLTSSFVWEKSLMCWSCGVDFNEQVFSFLYSTFLLMILFESFMRQSQASELEKNKCL